ncbi:hypothetical protein K8W59_20055 [Nocardioides rotundus]|uniref:hypothetical protein n=1 Tax=Nocardioides rotundus TaxID=1774216 RepID=UPI001CC12155|nr:hypothetical protein [Nocardioides rotundus]UAL29979.1 hypothetical protein K8W59_20055 [Nocardioides rotundus]
MPERDLTPAQAEEVRRLLADARSTEPMPDGVAERLDRVVADLSAERANGTTTAPDRDELAARRRRRRIGAGLLAAAAVTVVGFSVPNLMTSGGSSGNAGSDAGESAEQGAASDEELQDRASAPTPPAEERFDELSSPPSAARSTAPPPTVRAARFEQDVARATVAPLSQDAEARADTAWCPSRPAWGTGEQYPVVWVPQPGERERAVLVQRPPRGGEQTSILYLCGADEPVRSATVPAD